MRILDKYILLKIIKGYLSLLFLFLGLFIIIDVFSNLESFLKNKITFLEIINYYFFSLPFIFLKVSAFSLLISSIYLFGELNKNNELIGMRIAGLSILRIILPVLTFSIIISLFSLFVQEKILLFSQKRIEKTKLRLLRNKKITAKENLAFRYQNMIFFVSSYSPKENILRDVIIFKENAEGDISEKIIAKKIINKNNQWEAEEVIIYPLSKDYYISPVYKKKMLLDIKNHFEDIIIKRSIFSQFSSLKDLRKERERLKKMQVKQLVERLTIQYHKRLSEPFSHLFLVIGVLPFALEIRKRKLGLVSFGVGFFFSFIYYVIFSISLALGKAEMILPFLCCWIAPLFFIILGLSGLFLIK